MRICDYPHETYKIFALWCIDSEIPRSINITCTAKKEDKFPVGWCESKSEQTAIYYKYRYSEIMIDHIISLKPIAIFNKMIPLNMEEKKALKNHSKKGSGKWVVRKICREMLTERRTAEVSVGFFQ